MEIDPASDQGKENQSPVDNVTGGETPDHSDHMEVRLNDSLGPFLDLQLLLY